MIKFIFDVILWGQIYSSTLKNWLNLLFVIFWGQIYRWCHTLGPYLSFIFVLVVNKLFTCTIPLTEKSQSTLNFPFLKKKIHFNLIRLIWPTKNNKQTYPFLSSIGWFFQRINIFLFQRESLIGCFQIKKIKYNGMMQKRETRENIYYKLCSYQCNTLRFRVFYFWHFRAWNFLTQIMFGNVKRITWESFEFFGQDSG